MTTPAAAPAAPRALLFDVFGTLVDWRGTLLREIPRLVAEAGAPAIDAAGLADAWRGAYAPAMDRVRRGERPWATIDELHAEALGDLAPRFHLADDARLRARLVACWHRLDPWPEVPAAHARLRRALPCASLSNGNVALLVELARHARLSFDTLFSAELFRHYKPDRETYLGAAALLGLAPHEVALIAAHPSDLRAAAACGLRTVYVARPLEHGAGNAEGPAPDDRFDRSVADLTELADALGAPA